jgi:DNA-binding NtrC family response regulator
MHKKSILVVDDEEIIRDFLGEVLGEDYDVSLARDGDEAIEMMKHRRYDLVITDMMMPKVSGEEVVGFAKGRDPDYKVIVISGYSTLFAAGRSVTSGACAFLTKPFSIVQLMQAVTDAVE